MIRTLLIIAGAGLVLAVACFGGALALGGPELMRHGWNVTIQDDPWEPDNLIIMPGGESETRTFDWTGGERLEIGMPAEVTYTQAAETRLEISGPSDLLDRITVQDGRIDLTDEERVTIGARRDRLHVTLTAPEVRSFLVVGSGELDIRDYDHDRLDVRVNGSGDVRGSGRTEALSVAVHGSGEVDLRALEAERAAIAVRGSGRVDAAPSQAANVEVHGSGGVRLRTEPARLTQTVRGSGEIRIGG